MSESIDEAYHVALMRCGVPGEPVTTVGDWHFRLMSKPSFQREVIFDLIYRSGRALFYRSQPSSSVWAAVNASREQPGQTQPFTVTRACVELPSGHPLVDHLQNEAAFRLDSRALSALDDEGLRLLFVYPGGLRRGGRIFPRVGIPAGPD